MQQAETVSTNSHIYLRLHSARRHNFHLRRPFLDRRHQHKPSAQIEVIAMHLMEPSGGIHTKNQEKVTHTHTRRHQNDILSYHS